MVRITNPSLQPLLRAIAPLAVLTLAGCSFSVEGLSFGFGNNTLDDEKLETEISQGLTTQTGLVTTAVTCPEDQTIEAGNVFNCEAALEGGQTLAIQVTQNDDEGNVNWSADEGLANLRGLISSEALETQIAQGIAEQLNIEATIDCGAPYRILLTGETFNCTATNNSGNSASVEVTAEDDAGNVVWRLQ